jgi:hypothetical protein
VGKQRRRVAPIVIFALLIGTAWTGRAAPDLTEDITWEAITGEDVVWESVSSDRVMRERVSVEQMAKLDASR